MKPILLVWDQEHLPEKTDSNILFWNSYKKDINSESLPEYLEKNSIELRAKYLGFIADLGFSTNQSDSLINALDIGDGLSYWHMTTLVE